MMRLHTHSTPETFLRHTVTDLERDEARNSLILGAATAMAQGNAAGPDGSLFATVVDTDGLALAAMMAPPHPLVLASDRETLEPTLEPLVRHLRKSGVHPPAVVAPRAIAERFSLLWSRASQLPARVAMQQRLYALTEVRPLTSPKGRLRRAEESDRDLVTDWMSAFDAEALGELTHAQASATAERRVAAGEIYLWEDGEPRAMAARARPTRGTVAVNAVYTPRGGRENGYATACVLHLSRLLLEEGFRMCVLFTDLANPTSSTVYTRIGYAPVCDFSLYRFGA
ncbi:MAG: GNAT family N-acetyltransferase [Gemmatimonadetes bacterium]|nr:GNAT family N-acetyltransferase [Gemmatimonadota bacterium]